MRLVINKQNILPIIGIGKQVKAVQRTNKEGNKFRINDIIDKAKVKVVNKYAKYHRLHLGNTSNKTSKESPGHNRTHRKNYSDVRVSNLSIQSGLNRTVEDPYWKKEIKSPYNASIRSKYLLQSTQDDTSDISI
jgi:hypothetical protein